ncbi:MAG: ATP-binding cassette domain-containing protein [Deltaproteobacteria bacterium]|nr:ATP-binding cassette domain-containing protein [Deltaproteobacteria bacterium]
MVVRIENVKKVFGPILALNGISLEVERGKIFGLLGPNGAGKTTTIKILTTLVRPDSGRVEINGLEVAREAVRVRGTIGYVPQELTVDTYLTAREHLAYFADLYHLAPAIREARIQELLALMNLERDADRRVKYFSGGMKKKLDLACGLIHRPPLILLDEPSLGLDVRVRRDVWDHILRLKEQGATVFVCTNYMDEAERLCDDVAIIDHGKIAARGSPGALKGELKRDIISVEIGGPNGHFSEEALAALQGALDGLGGVKATMRNGKQLKVYVESNEMALPRILQSASALAVPIYKITYSRPGLDEVFLHYTGHAFAAESESGV